MKKIQQIIYFCLINYVGTVPNDLFDELWQTNPSEPQANNNPIESQPKIKVEPDEEEQFDGRWQDESALKGNVKVEHEPHFGAVKVEGEPLHKNDGDYYEHWNNLTDQDESVDELQNESNECEKIESDQQKREIIQKFREIKDNYQKKNKRGHSAKEWVQSETKISNGLGVCRTTIYKWIRELNLNQEKFSVFEKREILKQFDKIKSKCKQAKFNNISMRELDKKIAKKLGISKSTIYEWKREFDLTISDATKIGILKKYAKMKRKNPKMTNTVIAGMLKISPNNLRRWKKQFKEEIENL